MKLALSAAVALAGVDVKVYNQLTPFSSVGGAAPVVPALPTVNLPATSAPTAASAGSGAMSLIEIHYTSVLPASMNNIAMFLEATGQAKRG